MRRSRGREEGQDQRRQQEEEKEEVEEEETYSSSVPTLRRGQMRYHRLHPFSRLPPVPERPSLENRELSPVPDIVSPTSPILAPTSPPAQAPPPASSRRSSLPSPHRPGSGSREASPRKREVEVDQEENLVERRAGLGEGGPSATL